MFVKPFHGPIGLQKLDGGFFSDPRNPRNVVRRVAHQAKQVNDLFRALKAIPFFHLFRTPNACRISAPPRAKHANFVAHQLGKIFVWGHHEDVESLLFGTFGQTSNQVVRLISGRLKHRDAHAFEDAHNPRNTQLDVFRRFVTIGLVRLELLGSQCGSRGVKHHGQVRGFLRANDLHQGVCEAKHRRRVHAFGVDAWIFDECVISPKNQGVSIHQKQFLVRGRGDHFLGFLIRGTALHASPNMRLRTTVPMRWVKATSVAGPPAVAHPFTMTRWSR